MKGPTYIEKQPHKLKFLEYSMSKHYQQLESIKTKKSRLIDCSTPETLKRSLKNNHQNDYRNNEIYRENQSLLEKILCLAEHKEKSSRLQSNDSRDFFPKSMNYYKRKLDKIKIYNENKAFASRLASVSPSMQRKSTEKEYNFHVKYKKNLCKFDVSDKNIVKRVKLESLSNSSLHKPVLNESLVEKKNPYLEDENFSVIKKEYKIASIYQTPNSNYLMAIPFAINTIL